MSLLDSSQIFNIFASISFQIAQCRFLDNRDRLKEIQYSPPVQKTEFYAHKIFFWKVQKTQKKKIKIKCATLFVCLSSTCLSVLDERWFYGSAVIIKLTGKREGGIEGEWFERERLDGEEGFEGFFNLTQEKFSFLSAACSCIVELREAVTLSYPETSHLCIP